MEMSQQEIIKKIHSQYLPMIRISPRLRLLLPLRETSSAHTCGIHLLATVDPCLSLLLSEGFPEQWNARPFAFLLRDFFLIVRR